MSWDSRTSRPACACVLVELIVDVSITAYSWTPLSASLRLPSCRSTLFCDFGVSVASLWSKTDVKDVGFVIVSLLRVILGFIQGMLC